MSRFVMVLRRCLLAMTLAAVLSAPAPAEAFAFISDVGCAPNRGAAWSLGGGPSRWWLQDDGYPALPLAVVESALVGSFDTWTEPCCSSFRHEFQGTTASRARGPSAHNIVGFETSEWPREFGSRFSTIAVTLPLITSACQIIEADMVFNAVGFDFRDSGSPTDLRSIATHEFGHWLGLDHTDAPGGTMLPWYSGGTAERTLTQDDEAGVCALYPVSCDGCAADSDCIAGETCDVATGKCASQACDGTDDCRAGSICWKGTCIAGCRADDECGGEEICRAGSCIRDPALCSTCAPCRSSAECGGPDHFCVDLGGAGVCTKECETSANCDGDSVCTQVSDGAGGSYALCFAPDAAGGGLCPADYVCEGSVQAVACPDLWGSCLIDGHCGGGLCLRTDEGRRCSCFCIDDGDCDADARCMPDGTGGSACIPLAAIDPCDVVECAEGLACEDGLCVDPCAGVVCGDGARCEAGACVSPCGVCGEDTRCDPSTGACLPIDPCTSMACGDGAACVVTDGIASCQPLDPCAGVVCDADESCIDGTCSGPDDAPCTGADCTPKRGGAGGKRGGGCSAGGADPSALGLAALALLARRRR